MDRLSEDELFTSPLTFMGAPYGRPGPGNKAAVLGIPFDCGTNTRIGARGGPPLCPRDLRDAGAALPSDAAGRLILQDR